MTVSILQLLGGILILYAGAEGMVRGSVLLGRRAGISPMVVGLTVVSIGTSAPELVVSLLAAARGSPDLAVGNVLGSNLANVGLILGLAALMQPLQMHAGVLRRDIPWMIALSLLVIPLFWNLQLGRTEGTILALSLFLYLGFLIRSMRRGNAGLPFPDPPAPDKGVEKAGWVVLLGPLALVVGGVAGLVLGGHGIVVGATELAANLGVPELLVGYSVVAVGTSLPELATTILAAVRREADLAVGNVVGSNIFNLTFVLGGTALVTPIPVAPEVLRMELPATILLSVLLLPLAWTRSDLSRKEGAFLLAAYGGAWVWILTVG